ncbi:MAG: c-type cytochrome, partial [Verrucomicrobiota bacterium]
ANANQTRRQIGAASMKRWLVVWLLSSALLAAQDAPELGYRLLTERAYLSPDFHQSDFDEIWRVWPAQLRNRAAKATKEERRKMAFKRYGLTERPNDNSGKPLQYVVDRNGYWTMNCFSCHGGSVYGQVIPGAPNNAYALQTLSEDMLKVKFQRGRMPTRMEGGSILMPLGTSNGVTNAVTFGIGLMHYRDKDLNLIQNSAPIQFKHHDLDAPAWWNVKKKEFLYFDGFAKSGHRSLMQFLLIPENGPNRFREWERDFKVIYEYIQNLKTPSYPGKVDKNLALKGRAAFERNCADCHGTYGENADYPNRRISQQKVGTDSARLEALPESNKERYAQSWFADYGRDGSESVGDVYVAPPLDGIWASAPYFHNGSVPTLWHVLYPDRRPKVWRRTMVEMDEERVGLQVMELEELPQTVTNPVENREYYDTQLPGKSAEGHEFPNELSDEEKRAVLEYLKTL